MSAGAEQRRSHNCRETRRHATAGFFLVLGQKNGITTAFRMMSEEDIKLANFIWPSVRLQGYYCDADASSEIKKT